VDRDVLELVFDNTRRAIARILATARDREHAATLIEGFWSYQLPGLDGLMAHIAASSGSEGRLPAGSRQE
jgi:hypothetical protein